MYRVLEAIEFKHVPEHTSRTKLVNMTEALSLISINYVSTAMHK